MNGSPISRALAEAGKAKNKFTTNKEVLHFTLLATNSSYQTSNIHWSITNFKENATIPSVFRGISFTLSKDLKS